MNQYTFCLRLDLGEVNMTFAAVSFSDAIKQIMESEKCPRESISFLYADFYLNFIGFMGECVLDRTKTLQDWLDNKESWYAQEYLGTRFKYDEDYMVKFWECIEIERQRVKKIHGEAIF